MSLMLELPPELETELAAEAAELGVPLSEYVLRILAGGRNMSRAPRTGAEVKKWGIPKTTTKAINLGHAVSEANRRHADPIAAILKAESGRRRLVTRHRSDSLRVLLS